MLKDVAKVLKHYTPDGTFLCRCGGDEFVLLTKESPENCKEIAHNILIKIKQHKFYDDIHISVSAGIAGGIRKKSENEDLSKTITSLINIASLASIKLKRKIIVEVDI
ncbi:diguanylate cyclase [Caloramator sp. E03]|uniref:GGDEF domain-containing protein n=1 Tax=Caloramator sp. E03 TaxID=2576307 RepID=UPI001110535C|nr:diguanylate cyclase [Caloramator sp. E03]QCX32972.1 diguanylate cyclase [Caloramator sp. E03]